MPRTCPRRKHEDTKARRPSSGIRIFALRTGRVATRFAIVGDDRPISPPPHHIEIAGERYGLGVSDPDRIDLVRLGWKEETLI